MKSECSPLINRFSLFAAIVALVVFASASAIADTAPLPFLDPLFTSNMVLQRGQSDPVWGWTTPGRTVTVSIAGKSALAAAGPDGKWIAMLPKLPVGGPYSMSVTGPSSVVLSNVLVGDVWLCSGQSNMQFGIGNVPNAGQEIAAANYPNIRLYWGPENIAIAPQQINAGQWLVCTPDNLQRDGDWGGFSAVAYYFGRDLYQETHVPIGLLHTSYGGTPAEAWTSEEALRTHMPDFKAQLDSLDSVRTALATGQATELQTKIAQWYSTNDPGSKSGVGWADPGLDDSTWKTMSLPGYFQYAGDPALAGINGIVWFRRSFDVPAAEAGQNLVLNMLADDNDTTWVNGTLVGATEGYNVPRAYTIPSAILKPTGNVIAVRVLDTGGVGGIYGTSSQLTISAANGTSLPLAGPWYYMLGAKLTDTTAYPVEAEHDPNYPTVLYNGMINPLIPFGIKGAVWYQGESNVGNGYQYRTLLPTMIADWRSRWNEPNFPFLIVQLAGYGQPPAQPGDDQTAELREAQFMTFLSVPNTGIATAVDIGDPNDIHPKNKQEVGRRLALVARNLAYHERAEGYGPIFESMKITGSTCSVKFSGSGGMITTDGAAPKGFAISGADKVWYWADAQIAGNRVLVSSPQVPKPIAVRYAWSDATIGNVASKDRLPMFPFRTDRYPDVSDWNHVEH